jgi:hypothetical protein
MTTRVLEGTGAAGAGVGAACTASSLNCGTLPIISSASENRSEEAEVDTGCRSARANSGNVTHGQGAREETQVTPPTTWTDQCLVAVAWKNASSAPRVRATVAAGVEKTAGLCGDEGKFWTFGWCASRIE